VRTNPTDVSKITFRADDALVEQLDALDASKSEVMREALREFLDRHPDVGGEREVSTDVAETGAGSTADEQSAGNDEPTQAVPGLTVNINLDGAGGASVDGPGDLAGDEDDEETCKQCGATVNAGHSFCPNCGEEHRRRPRCECGEEIRSDWAFCPGCGRRSSASDVFDRA
jgi:predicted transcriptional regulator/RNA polymerase subunit RPABC4/transcription elongation factor Spt4